MLGLACSHMAITMQEHRVTKTEFAKQVAAQSAFPLSRPRAPSPLSSTRSLASSPAAATVAIAGFGKFSAAERAAREGPATGQTIQIAASRGANGRGPEAAAQWLTRQPADVVPSRVRAAADDRPLTRGPAARRQHQPARRGHLHARVEPDAASTMPSRSSSTSAAVTRSERPRQERGRRPRPGRRSQHRRHARAGHF